MDLKGSYWEASVCASAAFLFRAWTMALFVPTIFKCDYFPKSQIDLLWGLGSIGSVIMMYIYTTQYLLNIVSNESSL